MLSTGQAKPGNASALHEPGGPSSPIGELGLITRAGANPPLSTKQLLKVKQKNKIGIANKKLSF